MLKRLPCRNPECGNFISAHKRKSNKSGRQNYCSSYCYSVASPGILFVFTKFFNCSENEFTRKGFFNLLKDSVKQTISNVSLANHFGISRSTLSNWFKKFGVNVEDLRIKKQRRTKVVLKYRDIRVGDCLCRIADPKKRVFYVKEKNSLGVVLEVSKTRSVTVVPRVLKLWMKQEDKLV